MYNLLKVLIYCFLYYVWSLDHTEEKVAIIHHIITQPYCFDFLLTEP